METDDADPKTEPILPLHRVQILADLIFASAMTIMVLNFELPDPDTIAAEEKLLDYFRDQRLILMNYMVSFLLIVVYWMKHLEHFSYLQGTTLGHIWLQVFLLMFLMVLPLSNTLYGAFSDRPGVQIAYCANVLMVGLFSHLSWRYATKDHRLVDKDLNPRLIADLRGESMVEPTAALLAIGAVFVSPFLVDSIFLLVPIIYGLQKKFKKRYPTLIPHLPFSSLNKK